VYLRIICKIKTCIFLWESFCKSIIFLEKILDYLRTLNLECTCTWTRTRGAWATSGSLLRECVRYTRGTCRCSPADGRCHWPTRDFWSLTRVPGRLLSLGQDRRLAPSSSRWVAGEGLWSLVTHLSPLVPFPSWANPRRPHNSDRTDVYHFILYLI